VTSIITLTFNNYEELLKTLSSLKAAPHIESVVVNGGSCPKTSDFLSSYLGPNISEKDHGIADAFNKGLALSHGNSVAFLNSGDVLLDPNYYKNAQEILDKNPAVAFVYADLWFEDVVAGKMLFCATRNTPYHLGKGMPFPHPTLIVRRSVFDAIGNFRTEYRIGMDFEWAIRLVKAGFKGQYLSFAPILMDGAGVSTTGEQIALLECQRALKEHGLYVGTEKLYFQLRKTKFLIRRGVLKFLGKKALKSLKMAALTMSGKNRT